ncbi:MAG: preprotein translocase subunit TatA [Halolamina sp.]
MVPLFGALPGGPEMLIIMLVMLVLFFGPVVAVVYLLMRRSGGAGVDDDEIAEMQARIDELEARIAAEGGDTGETDDEE